MNLDRERELVRLANSTSIRDSLALFFAGARLVRELLDALDGQRRRHLQQLANRDADRRELEGRMTVGITAAAVEAWRQATEASTDAPLAALDLARCRRAAAEGKPNVVLGEVTMQRVRR